MAALGTTIKPEWLRSVVSVGEGRGFVVEGAMDRRYVITAAHCLPSLPSCDGYASQSDNTCKELLGPLNTLPALWAKCLFADPVSDIAVLGAPDGQYDAYEMFVEGLAPFAVADVPGVKVESSAMVLSLDGQWLACSAQNFGGDGALMIRGAPIIGGMSGSPIITPDGSAVAVISISSRTADILEWNGPIPPLVNNLPGWLLRELAEGRQR